MDKLNLCISCFRELADEKVCPYCGAKQSDTPKEAFHLYPKTILHERYVMGKVLGNGGFGVTYKAFDLRLNKIVAIKEFFPAGLVNRIPGEKEIIKFPGEKGERFNKEKDKFLNEARIMAKFSNNPNIVDVFDFFEENNTAYIIMEFIDGILLKEYMKQNNGKLDVMTSLEIIGKVISGVEDIHKYGVIHRDISPDNIFLTEGSNVKIFDFGAARFSSVDQEKTAEIVVKQGYTPPEQYRNKSKQGPYTDVYAVGAMLYAMITGKVPEESVDRQIDDELKKPTDIDPSIPQYLDNVIMKALSIKCELRFQNMHEFAEALKGTKSVLMPEDELKKKKKIRTVSFAVIGAVICLCIGAGAVFKLITQDINMNRYIKEDSVVEIWIPISDNQEEAAKTQSLYNEVYDEFDTSLHDGEDGKDLEVQLDVNIQYIPESQYSQKLMEAKESDSLPDIYRNDLLDEGSYVGNADLEWMYKKIIKKESAESYLMNYTLRTSMNCNVLYINNKFNTDSIFKDVYSFKSLNEKAANLTKDVIPVVVNPACDSTGGNEDEKSLAINKTDEKDYAINQFINEKSACYLGRISEIPNIKANIKWYTIQQPLNYTYNMDYEEWSVKGSLSDKEKNYAAMYVLSWLMSEDAQEILYIDNIGNVPMNINTLKVYVNETHKNDDLSFIGDYYNIDD